MTVKGRLKNFVGRGVRLVTTYTHDELRARRNPDVELVLSAALDEVNALATVHFPVAYLDFLRTCIESSPHSVKELKPDSLSPDGASKRFMTLVDALQWGLPEMEFSVAKQIALIADSNRRLSEPKLASYWNWAGDTGLHFEISSSFGRKGRVLFNVIRFMRSECCLELGTAYGMSALFILAALKMYSAAGHLATIEGFEPQFSVSSSMLKQQYRDAVSCHFGKCDAVLPEVVKSLDKPDFMFHDAGHSREDYIRDFSQVIEVFAPGGVVLFDDIRWEDSRFVKGTARTYEGWKAVVAHPRVRRAIEIDGTLGLLLVR